MCYCGFWISELCLGFSNISVEPLFAQLQINYETYGTVKTIFVSIILLGYTTL